MEELIECCNMLLEDEADCKCVCVDVCVHMHVCVHVRVSAYLLVYF